MARTSLGGRVKSALDVLSMVAVTLASATLIWVLVIAPASTVGPTVDDVTGLRLDAAHVSNVSGTGPVAVVEFADFHCPFCGRHARDTLPVLRRELIEPGKIRYVAMHYPMEEIHPGALRAAEAAECAAAQGRFWEMHDRLFARPTSTATPNVLTDAEALGLDREYFEECLASSESLERIRADQAEGRRLGVMGTPTFFVGLVRVDGSIDFVTRIQGLVSAELLLREVESAASHRNRGQPHAE